MRTLSLAYNSATKTYILVDNPEFWRQIGRREISGIENVAKEIKEVVGDNPGKKIKIKLDKDSPAGVGEDLTEMLSGNYRVQFERVLIK